MGKRLEVPELVLKLLLKEGRLIVCTRKTSVKKMNVNYWEIPEVLLLYQSPQAFYSQTFN